MPKRGDRLGRRVSTHYKRVDVPRGTARIWTGTGGERCPAGFLPIRPLVEVGRYPLRQAKTFVQRRVGVPKVRPGQLYLTFDKKGRETWWLITDW